MVSKRSSAGRAALGRLLRLLRIFGVGLRFGLHEFVPPLAGNPDAGDAPTTPQSQRGAVTNLFYISNWYHDQLYGFGFDEAAGNFQTTNFSGMGAGGCKGT